MKQTERLAGAIVHRHRSNDTSRGELDDLDSYDAAKPASDMRQDRFRRRI
jgi:hypothetical protein